MLREFVLAEVDPQSLEHNRKELFNVELFRKLGGLGLLGITVDPQYGGSGMDAVAAVIAHEELAASDPAFCLSFLAHSMLFVNNLAQNGSHDQKLKYLPKACSGEWICGMGMSEPGAGTDVMGMTTTAKLSADGTYYTLTGAKMWITNGTINGQDTGDVFLVYAKTGPGRGAGDLTSFLVEKGMPGFTLGQKITDKCGMRASHTAELVFDGVKVPAANVVGKVGGATLCMMRNLEIERVTLAAMSLGIARRCIEVMGSYSRERQAFGKPIGDFGQSQKAIAESYAEVGFSYMLFFPFMPAAVSFLYIHSINLTIFFLAVCSLDPNPTSPYLLTQFMAGRSYVYNVAKNLDLASYGNGLDSDGVKLYCAPMAKNVADRAIQMLGGYGYVGEYRVEQLWRDAKLLEIGGGTNESHHKNMTRDLKKGGFKII